MNTNWRATKIVSALMVAFALHTGAWLPAAYASPVPKGRLVMTQAEYLDRVNAIWMGQMIGQLLGDRVVLGTFNRCDVLDVLDNRLILGAQIFVEPFDESTGVHAARFHARRRARTWAGWR